MSQISKKTEGNKIICEYKSSNIKGGEYNTEDKSLKLTFNNDSSYLFENVKHEIFAAFNLADSQGAFFNKNIKSSHKFKKL